MVSGIKRFLSYDVIFQVIYFVNYNILKKDQNKINYRTSFYPEFLKKKFNKILEYY